MIFFNQPQKLLPKKVTVLLVFCGIISSLQFTSYQSEPIRTNVEIYYLARLKDLEQKITVFKSLSQKKAGLKLLQQHFLTSRLSYKKLAVLTDYFNLYETKLLNGPALDWVEEDNPGTIISPRGFQSVEQLLFSDWKENSYIQLTALLSDMQQSILRLKNEHERINKFKDELVWDAVRSATVRLTATGITGFDSPIAQYSLIEARATIDGIKDILGIFKKELNTKDPKAIIELFKLLDKTKAYLTTHNNFNAFDRFSFITQLINSFYKQLLKTRLSSGIGVPQGKHPVNFDAVSIFAPDYMDINFFAPGKDYSVTNERISLGKKLFSDSILSGTHTRSCASCHLPEKAFTDGLKTPYAIDEKTSLTRNTPTLWYSGLQTRQFFDSRTDMLENQLDEVVHNVEEMKGSLKNSVGELKKDSLYKQLFQKAYNNEKEPVSAYNIANAISSYIRTLVAFNSRFDQAIWGGKLTLTADEKNGFNLFTGKAKCASCHFIPLFNGLVPPVFTETESETIGVPKTTDKKSTEIDPDFGKFLFTTASIHKYSFKTPTLRNVALTAPYMHNGVYKTLEEVMEFYNNGGGKGLKIAPPNQTLPFDRLNLSNKEVSNIIAFMKTLTDTVTQ